MKRMKQSLALLAALLCALFLAGCSVGFSQNTDDLLRAPQLPGDSSDIQTALNSYLGESAQLRYPTTGNLLSPFLYGDWNGDSVQDAAVLYTAGDSTNVMLAVLEKQDGAWEVTATASGLSENVEQVSFASMQDTAANQIIVGYSTQGDEYLAVYAYQDGELQTLLQQPYSQFLTEDITGKGHQDLVVLSNDAEHQVQIQILTFDAESGFALVQTLGLSGEKYTGCASLAAGIGEDKNTYLVLDGWTGTSGTYLASVILYFDEESQQLIPAALIDPDRLYNVSLRAVSALTSRDLTGDGAVEIPTRPEEAGLLNLSQGRRMDFIAWMDYSAAQPEKSFGLFDEEYGYYLELPAEWEGNILLTDGEEPGSLELRNLSGDILYMTLRVVDSNTDSAGWRRLGTVASKQIQIRLGVNAVFDHTAYSLSNALYLLQ